jgi:hypothetical protein
VCYHRDDFGPTRLQRPNFVRTEVAAIRDACDRRGIRVFLFFGIDLYLINFSLFD